MTRGMLRFRRGAAAVSRGGEPEGEAWVRVTTMILSQTDDALLEGLRAIIFVMHGMAGGEDRQAYKYH